MNKIVQVLMDRDGLEYAEAVNKVRRIQHRAYEGENPETMLREELSLEPDYVLDLL